MKIEIIDKIENENIRVKGKIIKSGFYKVTMKAVANGSLKEAIL